jgi:hypothetical protein
VSNEARHRDIAALRAKGLTRAQKQPLVAKAIESNMPNGQLYPAEHLLAAGSVRAKIRSAANRRSMMMASILD